MIQVIKTAIVIILGAFLLVGYFGVLVSIYSWFEEKERRRKKK